VQAGSTRTIDRPSLKLNQGASYDTLRSTLHQLASSP
jgi:hypothetical protein